eukprot:TRINITY_DN2254_c0_g1_i1.p1 TRINITY_DN2254_c0_g1~~TRINITY_DN2254_c0_g1_i1.p1  ORF type:complete len:1222 (-),score=82.42 TRINITY_DN2254_c0_g1_i1:381-4046(-)
MGWSRPRVLLLLSVSSLLLVFAAGVAENGAPILWPNLPAMYVKKLHESGRYKGALSKLPAPENPQAPMRRCRRPAFSTPRCHWCHGKVDGVYADASANPACSAFYTCQRQRLAAVDTCPDGTFFSTVDGTCGPLHRSSCAADSPDAAAATSATAAVDGAAGFVSVARGSTDMNRRRLALSLNRPVTAQLTNWAEVNALLALKSRVFDPYYSLATWVVPRQHNETNFICRWKGVNCSLSGAVVDLKLATFGLAGSPALAMNSIPPEIGNLTALTSLDLSGVDNLLVGLIGQLPPEIARLRSLQNLVLLYNKLSGPLPVAMSGLARLTSLDVYINNFTGEVPAWLGQLTALKTLNLGFNAFSGTVPAALSALVNLETFALKGNALTGALPEELGALTKAAMVEFQANQFSAPLPAFVAKLPGWVDLSFNQFSGPVPAAWAGFKGFALLLNNAGQLGEFPAAVLRGMCADGALGLLDLTNTSLTGALDWDVSRCPSLGIVYLEGNQLTGDVGEFLGRVPPTAFLNEMNLASNQLTGQLPASILQVPSLSILSVQENAISGPMPPLSCITSKIAPIGINVSVNAMEGPLPATWAEGCQINQLHMSNNRFTGALPAPILAMKQLVWLDVTNNAFEGPLPVPASCPGEDPYYLNVLHVGRNRFSGPVPAALGTCGQLQDLDASQLQLTGDLPQAFFRLGGGISVISVNLSRSGLTGPITDFQSFPQLVTLDLSGNAFSGPVHANLSKLVMLRTLDLSDNQLSGPIPMQLGSLSSALTISLHGNQLEGPIPAELAPQPSSYHLPGLHALDLASNQLTGVIPYGFANISADALALNVSDNQLSGAVPGGNDGALSSPATYDGNDALCGADGLPACAPNGNSLSAGAIAGIAVAAVVGLALIALGAWWFSRRNDPWSGGTMLVFEKLDFRLTVGHILDATEHFSDKYKLGRGGFGTVYRASLQDGRTVAIKRLAAQSTQGNREFQAEMETLGNIRHRNLVVLVAAYIAPGQSTERLLIYDFLSGGSVDTIFSKDLPKDSPFRKWSVRRSVALDTARGLKYLHHDCTPRIIHRDMKPANVLLDDQMVGYVADFGLAREIDVKKSHMSTAVFGTIGYLAPEYTRQGRLSFKSDVFAYGVMLLQLITGKQPTDEDVAERGLARWAEANGAAAIVDERMELAEGEIDQILGAVKLGLLCTARVAADRPSMPEIVHLLENLEDFAKGVGTTASKE